MSAQDNETPEPDVSFDPHRFTAENKRTPRKMILPILIAFIVVMAAIGGSVYFAKSRISAYMADRDAKSKAEKAKQQEDKNRKEKEFASSAPLPASFSTPKSPASLTEPITDLPVIPLPTGTPQKAPPPPRMMISDAGSDSNADKSAVKPNDQSLQSQAQALLQGQPSPIPPRPAEPIKQRIKTVQDLANQTAEKGPVTTTQQASAANLGDRSFVLARGAFIPCVLETQLVSNIPGSSSCVVPQDIYSEDGKVLLVDKGSKIVGSYQSTVIPGSNRIAILWQRIKTPNGVVLDVDSPSSDGVGTMGALGVVDNHWMERIGAAFLLSIVEDAVKIAVANRSAQQQQQAPVAIQIPGGGLVVAANNASNTPAPTATTSTITSMSQEVLKSTLNTPSTLMKNRGDRITVFVNRDLWFDSVYQLSKR